MVCIVVGKTISVNFALYRFRYPVLNQTCLLHLIRYIYIYIYRLFSTRIFFWVYFLAVYIYIYIIYIHQSVNGF